MLRFTIPDEGTLLAAGKLPTELRDTALLCAAHPEGADGYMHELVMQALVMSERDAIVTQAIEHGIELGHHLVASMLVDPHVTVDEVRAGEFPSEDIRMLLEFAERRRNMDAAGNRLPIIVAREWARFRDEPAGANGADDRDETRDESRGDVPDADRGSV